MNTLSFVFLLLIAACSTPAPRPESPALTITEIQPNKWTRLTRQNLEHLLKVYDLEPFLFTRQVQIQSRVIPHSHPTLTLNSRFAEAPHRLLAVFLHEQLHWWAEKKSDSIKVAKAKLMELIPVLPDKGLARNRESTYLHLIICFLEFRALQHYLGDTDARRVLKAMIEEDKIYPWIYQQVFDRYQDIHQVILASGLEPEILSQAQKPTKKP